MGRSGVASEQSEQIESIHHDLPNVTANIENIEIFSGELTICGDDENGNLFSLI